MSSWLQVSDEELTDEQDQLSEDEEKKSHSGGSVWEQAGQSAQLIPGQPSSRDSTLWESERFLITGC